jgi:hypothetical protein
MKGRGTMTMTIHFHLNELIAAKQNVHGFGKKEPVQSQLYSPSCKSATIRNSSRLIFSLLSKSKEES